MSIKSVFERQEKKKKEKIIELLTLILYVKVSCACHPPLEEACELGTGHVLQGLNKHPASERTMHFEGTNVGVPTL